MRIERSRPADAEALTTIAFEAKGHWGYPERWIQSWADVLTLTPEYIRANPTYSAIAGEEIAGFCALRLNGAEAAVDHLWIRPASMGKGIGRSLLRHCEKAARKAGATRLKVESDPNAVGFYQAMGFLIVGRQPAPMDGSERFLPLLEKSLA